MYENFPCAIHQPSPFLKETDRSTKNRREDVGLAEIYSTFSGYGKSAASRFFLFCFVLLRIKHSWAIERYVQRFALAQSPTDPSAFLTIARGRISPA